MLYTCENNPKYVMRIISRSYPESIIPDLEEERKYLDMIERFYIINSKLTRLTFFEFIDRKKLLRLIRRYDKKRLKS